LLTSLRRQWRDSQAIQGKSYQPRKPVALMIWGGIGTALIVLAYIPGVISLYNYSFKAGLMLLTLGFLALVYTGLDWIEQSPWGRVLKSIREDGQKRLLV
jgi:neutral amino acid transport system permease protein